MVDQPNLEQLAKTVHAEAVKAFMGGQDFVELLKESQRYHLGHWLLQGFIKSVMIRGGDLACCSRSRELDGIEMTVEQALREMPLPSEGCERPSWRAESLCACWYRAIVPGWRQTTD